MMMKGFVGGLAILFCGYSFAASEILQGESLNDLSILGITLGENGSSIKNYNGRIGVEGRDLGMKSRSKFNVCYAPKELRGTRDMGGVSKKIRGIMNDCQERSRKASFYQSSVSLIQRERSEHPNLQIRVLFQGEKLLGMSYDNLFVGDIDSIQQAIFNRLNLQMHDPNVHFVDHDYKKRSFLVSMGNASNEVEAHLEQLKEKRPVDHGPFDFVMHWMKVNDNYYSNYALLVVRVHTKGIISVNLDVYGDFSEINKLIKENQKLTSQDYESLVKEVNLMKSNPTF